ncbi:MAG: AEC family transporter [Oscillospiraceae bacterium]|nr:AEC family transporter [Oscillospiraceae bacterium]
MFASAINQLIIMVLLMAVGYGAARLKILDQTAQLRLSDIILKIALPASILAAGNMERQPQHLQMFLQIILIALVYFTVVFPLTWWLGALLHRRQKGGQLLFAFCVTFANVAFMGFPVVRSVEGDDAIFFASLFMMVFNLAIFIMSPLFMSQGERIQPRTILLQPGIISIAGMLLIFLFQIKLPAPLQSSLSILGDLCTPLSMLVVGAQLSQAPLHLMFTRPRLYLISAVRLLGVPILMIFLLRLLPVSPYIARIAVLINAMPIASLVAILMERYTGSSEESSLAVAQSMLFALPALVPVISLLQQFFPQ